MGFWGTFCRQICVLWCQTVGDGETLWIKSGFAKDLPARPTNGRGGNMSQLETNRSFTKACPRIKVAIEYGFSLPINLQLWSMDVSQTNVAIPARCLFRFPAMGVGSQFGTGPQGLKSLKSLKPLNPIILERCSTANWSDLHHPRSLFGEHGELLRWVPLVWRTRIDMTKLYQTLCHFTRIWQHNSEFRGGTLTCGVPCFKDVQLLWIEEISFMRSEIFTLDGQCWMVRSC